MRPEASAALDASRQDHAGGLEREDEPTPWRLPTPRSRPRPQDNRLEPRVGRSRTSRGDPWRGVEVPTRRMVVPTSAAWFGPGDSGSCRCRRGRTVAQCLDGAARDGATAGDGRAEPFARDACAGPTVVSRAPAAGVARATRRASTPSARQRAREPEHMTVPAKKRQRRARDMTLMGTNRSGHTDHPTSRCSLGS